MLGLEYRVRDYHANAIAIQVAVPITVVMEELNTIGARVAWARQQRKLTQQQLADRAGVAQSTIGSVESGQRQKPRELNSIARALEASVLWMETGEGPWDAVFHQDIKPGNVITEPGNRGTYRVADLPRAYGMEPILAWEHQDDLPEGEFVMIPRLDVHLSAGGGREQVEIDLVKDNPQAFRTEWIRLMRLKPNKLAAMRAAGESMEPTIHDGDSLLVDTSQTTVQDGKVYALWYDGGERVKRLFRLPGGGLRIVSDNARFPTVEVQPSEIEHVRVIGRVVHRSGTGGL
jgi:phage repressor protein C with HTH and peptisase S24 domain/DNA-binding XRE family transcriptional regulator